MLNKPIHGITWDDIQQLIDNEVPESRELEYKQQLPGTSDQDKHEFRADVTAFANAAGGTLIFGIKERRGADGQSTNVPEAVTGLSADRLLSAATGLEDILRYNVEPKLVGTEFRVINSTADAAVLLVRVRRSWTNPHAVRSGHNLRFYSRNSGGKYDLDVAEIRDAFLTAESFAERTETFRRERIARLVAGDTVLPLAGDAWVALHVLAASADRAALLSHAQPQAYQLRPLAEDTNSGSLYNFDGIVVGDNLSSGIKRGYTQLFGTGGIETVSSRLLANKANPRYIPSTSLEHAVLDATHRYVRFLRDAGASPPIGVALTLIGVRGSELGVDEQLHHWDTILVDRDVLMIPAVAAEDFDADITQLLRAAFDRLWQAGGYDRCRHYADDGSYIAP